METAMLGLRPFAEALVDLRGETETEVDHLGRHGSLHGI
jgi:hypothetical protein